VILEEISESPIKSKLLSFNEMDEEALDAIELCAKHQKVITNDVLSISKWESNQIVLNKVECNPEQIIKIVIKMFQMELLKKEILMEFLVKKKAKNLIVKIDTDRFSQVMTNLLRY
jgi:signal transduction histidine kinase